MRKQSYLVAMPEQYVRDAQMSIKPDAEHINDEVWVDVKSATLLLGTYFAETEQEAIEMAAAAHGVEIEMLSAYEVTPLHSPLVEAVRLEIEYIVKEQWDQEYAEHMELIKENLTEISEEYTEGDGSYFNEAVRDALDTWLKGKVNTVE